DFHVTGVQTCALPISHVEGIFRRTGRKHMPAMNIGQADVLANATVLFNDVGTAPGMAVERNDKYFAFLPGVPFEMKFLMENRVRSEERRVGKECRSRW